MPALTEEQRAAIEVKRLKAKAIRAQKEREQQLADVPNINNKRPLTVASVDSVSPTAPDKRSYPSRPVDKSASNALSNALQDVTGAAGPSTSRGRPPDDPNKPLRKDPRLGKYFEYDLSTLKNSKGGFLMEDELDNPAAARERDRLEQLKQERLKNQGLDVQDPVIQYGNQNIPKCEVCGQVEIDQLFKKVFRTMVCAKCKEEYPDRYSLLTKTECKEDYLLTDPELRDADILPHLLKANPHRATYSNMMLFLRQQVEQFAFSPQKWGSPEALDAEFERREAEKKKKKTKKFDERLKELRRRTRPTKWSTSREEDHVHDFGGEGRSFRRGDGTEVQKCQTCGLEVEIETF